MVNSGPDLLRPVEHWVGGAKCCEVAGAGAGSGCVGEVGVDAGEVDRGAGELVLEAGLRETAVAGSAQAAAPDALGDGAFDAGADLVAVLPGVGLLLGAAPGGGLRVLRGAGGSVAGAGAGGGALQSWTGQGRQSAWREADPDHGRCLRASGRGSSGVLVLPPGQVTCWSSQSMVNVLAVKPLFAAALAADGAGHQARAGRRRNRGGRRPCAGRRRSRRRPGARRAAGPLRRGRHGRRRSFECRGRWRRWWPRS